MLCEQVPEDMVEHMDAVLAAAHSKEVLAAVEALIDSLDSMLMAEALIG
jgi:hypothetical protein